MNQSIKDSALNLCRGTQGVLVVAGLALVIAGCSRNVSSVGETAVAETPAGQQLAPADTTPAEPEPSTAATTTPKATSIQWEKSLDSALARARETQKPIMIDFFATWCGPCKMLDSKIYPAADVVQEAEHFVSVKIDVDKEQEIAAKYQITAMPTIVFLDPSGRELHRTQGVSDQVSWMVDEMQNVRAKVVPTAA